MMSPTPMAGTSQPSGAWPSPLSRYVANVRATRLSLMTIDSAISSAAPAATVVGP